MSSGPDGISNIFDCLSVAVVAVAPAEASWIFIAGVALELNRAPQSMVRAYLPQSGHHVQAHPTSNLYSLQQLNQLMPRPLSQ